MVRDDEKLTPLGNPYIRWAQPGEETNTIGNCIRTKVFHIISEKGYTKDSNAEAKLNPICATCNLSFSCRGRNDEGVEVPLVPGATFRRDRAEALQNDRIRAHIQSMPSIDSFKEGEGEEEEEQQKVKVGAFIDEVMRHVSWTEKTTAGLSDLDKTILTIPTNLWFTLLPIVQGLRPLLAGEDKLTQETYHGYSDEMLRQIFIDHGINLIELKESLAEIEETKIDIKKLMVEPDSVSQKGMNAKDRKGSSPALKIIRKKMRDDATREMYDNLRNLQSNWLIPLVKVLVGEEIGAIRIKNKQLIITTKNRRAQEIINELDFVEMLDATADRQFIAKYLEIDKSEILWIEQEKADFSNLTIHQIRGMGLLGKERSKSVIERITALRPKLIEMHPDIAFIDHLATKEEGDGHWFFDNRGSNQYENRSAIASLGTPYPDIGMLQDVYMSITGDRDVSREAEGFSAFVRYHVQSERVQFVGRLRANRRPEQEVTCAIVSDDDLQYLLNHYPGAKIVTTDAFNIVPEAGTAGQRTKWAILQAIKVASEAGRKITQNCVADIANCSQATVSKIAKDYGGWNPLRKLLLSLIDSFYRNSNNLPVLDPDLETFAKSYLPAFVDVSPPEAVQELLLMERVFGTDTLMGILGTTTLEVRSALLGKLFDILPPELRAIFEEILLVPE